MSNGGWELGWMTEAGKEMMCGLGGGWARSGPQSRRASRVLRASKRHFTQREGSRDPFQ